MLAAGPPFQVHCVSQPGRLGGTCIGQQDTVRWSAWGFGGLSGSQNCALQLLVIVHAPCMLDMNFKDCDAFASVECCTKPTSLKLGLRSHCADLSRSLTARIRRMTCFGNTCARALAGSLADLHLCLLRNPTHQAMMDPAASKDLSAGRTSACSRQPSDPLRIVTRQFVFHNLKGDLDF